MRQSVLDLIFFLNSFTRSHFDLGTRSCSHFLMQNTEWVLVRVKINEVEEKIMNDNGGDGGRGRRQQCDQRELNLLWNVTRKKNLPSFQKTDPCNGITFFFSHLMMLLINGNCLRLSRKSIDDFNFNPRSCVADEINDEFRDFGSHTPRSAALGPTVMISDSRAQTDTD